MFSVAVVDVPDLSMQVFKFNFFIHIHGRREIRTTVWLDADQLTRQVILGGRADLISGLLDRIFREPYISNIGLKRKEIVIYVSPGFDRKNTIGPTIAAISDIYNNGEAVRIIRAKRIFLDGISFDIPLGQEITICEREIVGGEISRRPLIHRGV